MGRKKFQQLRLALFVNSYCGRYLARVLKTKYSTDRIAALREISLLANALNLRKRSLLEVVTRDRCFRKFICSGFFICPKDVSEIPIFLAIEKEVIEIAENKFLETLLEVEDYDGGILEFAIERAAGNKLSKVEDDGEFEKQLEELKKHYRRYYYHVAYRFKLPTVRILPFIMRLIAP